jgi:hypothetical protein
MDALAVPASGMQNSAASAATRPTDAVLAALANEKYQWRTIDGITRETGLSRQEVASILASELADVVIRSAVKDRHGRTLYTTRIRYKKTRTLGSRILSALSDQVR